MRSGALISGWQELGDVIVGDRASKTSRGDARVVGQVRIRPSAKKLLNGLTLPAGVEDGSEKGRVAERVLGVDGCSGFQQQPDRARLSLLGGEVKWRETLLVCGARINVRRQVSLEPIQIALERAVVELQSTGGIHLPILPPNQRRAAVWLLRAA